MKKLTIISLLALLFSCSSDNQEEKTNTQNEESKTEVTSENESKEVKTTTKTEAKENTVNESNIVTDFLQSSKSLESNNSRNPIVAFQEIANSTAAKKATISKSNIQEMLNEAKNYKYCIITVKDHTIVKIDDIDNCTQSGSWGVCMPHAKGYIKRGGNLDKKEDYINNIIGLPHGENRTMYLFN